MWVCPLDKQFSKNVSCLKRLAVGPSTRRLVLSRSSPCGICGGLISVLWHSSHCVIPTIIHNPFHPPFILIAKQSEPCLGTFQHQEALSGHQSSNIYRIVLQCVFSRTLAGNTFLSSVCCMDVPYLFFFHFVRVTNSRVFNILCLVSRIVFSPSSE